MDWHVVDVFDDDFADVLRAVRLRRDES